MKNLNEYIDHTMLKPNATKKDIEKTVSEAKKYHFASVCVNPYWVSYVHTLLKDSPINIVTVIGFPLGATTTKVKVFEAEEAIKNGADECDMVQNIGEFIAKNDEAVLDDERKVAQAVHAKGKILKVIIENCFLNSDQIKRACQIAERAGADFVKTSTGFARYGARKQDVKIMYDTVGDKLGIKAAGGIHTKQDAIDMIKNGATRIGASSSVKIMEG